MITFGEFLNEKKLDTELFAKIVNLINTRREDQAKEIYNNLAKTSQEEFRLFIKRSKVLNFDEVMSYINEVRASSQRD